jgi:Holliday junction resolvase
MSPAPRWRNKPDANQRDIVDALEKVGAKVYDASQAGSGFPDLLVGYRSCLYLLEIKTGKSKLNKQQLKFHNEWQGFDIYVVRSPMQALEAIGAVLNV